LWPCIAKILQAVASFSWSVIANLLRLGLGWVPEKLSKDLGKVDEAVKSAKKSDGLYKKVRRLPEGKITEFS
jgi:hypothetical protein